MSATIRPRLPIRLAIAALAAGISALPSAALAAEGPRHALVIGNADYLHLDPLPAVRRDVARMQRLLAAAGFRVQVLSNATRSRLGEELVHFDRRTRDADVALIYYAGHGLQVDGQSYLLPVDARLEDELSFSRDLVRVDAAMLALNNARRRVLILDAARPGAAIARFADSLRVRRYTPGLRAPQPLPPNTVVALAAAPDRLAPDAQSRFTAALASALEAPGVPLTEALQAAARQVAEQTNGAQQPWISGSLSPALVLRPGPSGPPAVATAPQRREPAVEAPEPPEAASPARGTGAPDPEPPAPDHDAFQQAYAANSPEAWRAFLAAYPDSPFAATARRLLSRLSEGTEGGAEQPESGSGAVAGGRRQLREMAPDTRFRDCQTCPEMVVLPRGMGRVGSPESEAERSDAESPMHAVRIAYPLAAGVHEVTRGQWQACVADGACSSEPETDGDPRLPVSEVSWEDAQSFAAWLSRRTGRSYRLPSEAEWEYAARAGTATPFAFGACIDGSQANYNATRPYDHCRVLDRSYLRRPAPVGSYPANAWGLHDTAGNVWEWTADCWHPHHHGAPSDGSARLDGDCSFRVARGGGFTSHATHLRSAYRNAFYLEERSSAIGFRVFASGR